jgi:hypothetical protein
MVGVYNTWNSEAKILKLDSNLNLIWTKQINTVSEGYCDVINHKNQYYTVLSMHLDSTWNFSYFWGRVSLTRLDLNGNIIWQKYYGVKKYQTQATSIHECANGDLIMCGIQPAVTDYQGWIMRTDSIGNLKWWRNYRPQTSPILDTITQNYLHDILELPNGDIAAVGWAGGSSISPLQQTWLLKVDSNGCFGAGICNPNLYTSTVGIKQNSLAINNTLVSAYPNPANTELTIEWAFANELVNLSLVNNLGQAVYSQELKTNTVNIPTQQLAPGLYILNLKTKQGNLSKKIIIEH